MELINGHKTQIGAIAGLVIGLCVSRGWIPADIAQVALAIVGVWTGAAIAHHEIKGRK